MPKKKVATEVVESVESELFKNVRAILAKARATVYTAANTAMVEAYWNVGREIVEKQGGASRAKYGDGLVKSLAVRLTAEFGEGFTAVNLFNMRQFYLTFPKFYALRRELTWTHYRILMRVESDDARDYYFNECVAGKWSTRILQRQIDTQFYERLVRNHSPKAARGLVKRGAAQRGVDKDRPRNRPRKSVGDRIEDSILKNCVSFHAVTGLSHLKVGLPVVVSVLASAAFPAYVENSHASLLLSPLGVTTER